jgi:site-specific DNA-methyltransferase (adenine-specific)
MKIEPNNIYLGDCLDLMKYIPDKSIDMILADLPYGTTKCKWDTIIPFEPLWEQYKRIIKDSGATVLTATQPFASALVMSNPKMFKYEWIWNKITGRGHLVAKYRPMAQHENILVFGNGRVKYNPQMILMDKPQKGKSMESSRTSIMGGRTTKESKIIIRTHKYPKTIITQGVDGKYLHPTQKPVALCEYLIKTYTNEGETVLDNCMGSGTTAVACINTNRKYIGIEKELKYFEIAKERIESVTARLEAVKSQISIFDEPEPTEKWEQAKFI